MKILQVTAGLNEGGVERGTLEMAAYTVARGVESHVASSGGKLVSQLEAGGARHHQLPLARRDPLAILQSSRGLARIIREQGIDLVHARSRAPAWAALLASRWTGTHFLTTFHGTHRIQNHLKWYYNSVMVRGERVIAISDFIRQHIIEHYRVDPGRIDVAPRGFDPAIFDPDSISAAQRAGFRETLGIAAEVPVVALPGRLTRWKGQEPFLRALGALRDLSWQALIIGGAGKKGAYAAELQQLAASLGIGARVHFLGSRSDIASCYAASDLVVSASTEPEAFGRVAVEGQAMARPVIASAHGGSIETVKDGETGWLYDPRSPDALARVLRVALADAALRERVGKAGRSWVLGRFTVERMCAAEWAAYEKVLAGAADQGRGRSRLR